MDRHIEFADLFRYLLNALSLKHYRRIDSFKEPILILADPKGVNYVLNSGCALYPRSQEDLFILDTMVQAFEKRSITQY